MSTLNSILIEGTLDEHDETGTIFLTNPSVAIELALSFNTTSSPDLKVGDRVRVTGKLIVREGSTFIRVDHILKL